MLHQHFQTTPTPIAELKVSILFCYLLFQGLFSSVIKDITGSKAKPVPEIEKEDVRDSIEELSTIFSTANFPLYTEDKDNMTINNQDEDEVELDIGISKDMCIPYLSLLFNMYMTVASIGNMVI